MAKRSDTFQTVKIGRKSGWGRDVYHAALSITWPKFFLWLVPVYLAINALFGTAYYFCGWEAFDGAVAPEGWSRWLECFFFSVQTLGTIGYGKMSPAAISSNLLVTLEALVGLLSMALVTGLVFSRFSRPTARVIFSRVALIADHDGIPSLLFRIANERQNQIVDADIQVYLLRNEVTAEGESYYTFNDLKLERSHTPIFSASWTVVHPIDRSSPLHGKTKEQLVDADAQIIVSFTGVDEIFAQPIRARYTYSPDEVVWDHRFLDMIERLEDTLNIHLGKIHEIEPVPPLNR
jgi:inward rectifier potassium channel